METEPWKSVWVFGVSAVIGYFAGGLLRMLINFLAKLLRLSQDPLLEISVVDAKLQEDYAQWVHLQLRNIGYKYVRRTTKTPRSVIVFANIANIQGNQHRLLFTSTKRELEEERHLIHNVRYSVPFACIKWDDRPFLFKGQDIEKGKCYITDDEYLTQGVRQPLTEGEYQVQVIAQWQDGGFKEEWFTLTVPNARGRIILRSSKGKHGQTNRQGVFRFGH